METKQCTLCNRILPKNTDYFSCKCDSKDGFTSRCKECCGRKFTNKLTHIPKQGYVFCKKCDRELPHTFQFFPEDRNCKTGLRYVCRECNKSYGRFLDCDELPNRMWSQNEIEILKSVYADYPSQDIHNKFLPNRTIRAIECEAVTLGIQGKKSELGKERGNQYRSQHCSESLIGVHRGDEWRKKLSAIKKEYYKTHDTWNKGKHLSPEQCRMISERRKGKWAGTKNPRHKNPLCGASNGRWKGGILSFYQELRSDTKEWLSASSEFCDYKCVITGVNFDECHHTTPFYDIVDETFKISDLGKRNKVSDYSDDEFNKLRTVLKSLHIQYGYGACLNKKVHQLFHENYGYKNFSAYDFLDFIYRIDVGEFDSWFMENELNININYDYITYLENTLSIL